MNNLGTFITHLHQTKPLVHHITNYVTVNDCANITLGIGASPVMADAIEEAADIASIADALVLNIGTLNSRTVAAMVAAGKAANAKGIPVVLDPVGVGASAFRNRTTADIIDQVKIAVLRGNISEIKFIAGLASVTKGVDASEADMADTDNAGDIATLLAEKLNCTVVISGAVDIIANGNSVMYVKNGHPMLGNLTGTGCMCSSLIGAFCGAMPHEIFLSAVAAMVSMGIAGELAYAKASALGNGSFHTHLHDVISQLDSATIETLGKYYE